MPTDQPEVTKLRVKIGPHEFEAEGSRDVVAKHFETWMQVVVPRPPGEDTARKPAAGDVAEREIFTADMQRHLITLRASLVGKAAFADAALLILYGYWQRFGADGQHVLATRLKAAMAPRGTGATVSIVPSPVMWRQA